MPYLDLPDTRLFFTERGSGPAMLLIHGYTCDSADWSWSLPLLAEHYRVISYDRRGEGRSAPASDYSMASQVGDVLSMIDALGGEPPIVVGHSLGGAIASSLAVEHPGAAHAVVVLDPPYAAEPEVAAASDSLKPALSGEGSREAVKQLWRAICYTPATPEWLKVLVERRVDALTSESLYGNFVSMWDHVDGIARRPQADAYLARRSGPVLAIHSSREFRDYERSTFSDSRSRAIDWPGTGHWVQVERPREFASVLHNWVSAL
jgi:pimeloyl-ACP methyl ester carboxylesterase